MIIDYSHPAYQQRLAEFGDDRFNGAVYYSREITENIIPRVRTDRNWVTVDIPGLACDHSIVFIHSNVKTEQIYDWLSYYRDLILVCGIPETMEKVRHLGTPVYLPLSVDVEYVKQFRTEKTRETAFVGREERADEIEVPSGVPFITGLPRTGLLREMAKYKTVYGLDRVAIEAKILGCKVLPYPDLWPVLDNKDAADMLQEILDEIDENKHSRNRIRHYPGRSGR